MFVSLQLLVLGAVMDEECTTTRVVDLSLACAEYRAHNAQRIPAVMLMQETEILKKTCTKCVEAFVLRAGDSCSDFQVEQYCRGGTFKLDVWLFILTLDWI
jgi:hypothetical protein